MFNVVFQLMWILLLPLLVGCNKEEQSTEEFKGVAMTVPYRILIGKKLNRHQTEEISSVIALEFEEIDQLYNKWNPHSELSYLNSLKANQKVPISKKLEYFLKYTDRVVQITENRFDPTIEPLQKLWKSKLADGFEPSDEELSKISSCLGWDHIHISDGLFWKDSDGTELDLGGIAKGYFVDLLVERLNTLGYKDVFVEWGGEIRTSGRHPSGRPWRIFISNFGDSDVRNAIAIVSLENQAIATSGDYLQKWETLGATYFHIFDMSSKKPLKSTEVSIGSVSVCAASCALADTLATALMTFSSVDEAEKWAESLKSTYPELKFWIKSRRADKQG